MKKLLVTLILLFLPCSAWSAVITAKNGGGNWSETTTWVGGVVPYPGVDTVVIPATLAAAVTLNDSRTIPATTVEDEVYGLVQGSGVTTTLGGELKVGNGTDRDGKFVFGAGATLALGANNITLNNCVLRSNSTAGSWAAVTGTGAMNTGAVSQPKQNILLTYVSFQNTGVITFAASLITGNQTSLLNVQHCTFIGNGAITIGAAGWTGDDTQVEVNYNDFRDLTGNIILTGQLGTVDRQFKFNTLATSGSPRGVQAMTNTDFTGSIFYRITPNGVHTEKTIFDEIFVGKGGSDGAEQLFVPAITGRIFANSYIYTPTTATNPHVVSLYYDQATDNDVTDNVFEIGGTEPNVLMIYGGDAAATGDITGNIHIGRGAFFNIVGDHTFGTINIKNNTVYTNDGGSGVHQGIFLAENGEPTGTLNISSNLHSATSVTLEASIWDNNSTPAVIAFSDYNNFYGLSDGTPYYGVTVTAGQTNDMINTTDPVFVDPNSGLGSWGAEFLGTDGSDSAAITKLLQSNGYNDTAKTQADTPSGASVYGTSQSLTNWVRAGFAPTNMALATAGYGGTYIGAVEPVASASGAAMLMGW